MTQKELAAKVGVNVRWIQKLEYGETLVENVTGIKLLKLAEALEVDPHDLVKW
jgi:transcriptional regulator with XRE-family HTH domain